MKGAEAMEALELIPKEKIELMTIDEAVEFMLVGQIAVRHEVDLLKQVKKLKLAKKREDIVLKQGQYHGEILLKTTAHVGKLAAKEKRADPLPVRRGSGFNGTKPSGKPPKHERLGMPQKQMHQAQTVAENPAVVKKVIEYAKKNRDIPTKTAVLSEIRYQKEKERRKKAEGKNQKTKLEISASERAYISKLEKVARILPPKPPKTWSEKGLKMARVKAQIIIKRLGVFYE